MDQLSLQPNERLIVIGSVRAAEYWLYENEVPSDRRPPTIIVYTRMVYMRMAGLRGPLRLVQLRDAYDVVGPQTAGDVLAHARRINALGRHPTTITFE